VPLSVLENTFAALGLREDLEAAEQAFDLVRVREPRAGSAQSFASSPTAAASVPVKSISEHRMDSPADLKTGSWSSQAPLYRQQSAPCNIACPAGNDVAGFIQALRKEGVQAAAAILLATQPLPSVCGRVCPAPCINSCNRLALDGAVNIRSLERWIGDHADLGPALKTVPSPYRIAIVGGGPAGLGAAWTLACEGHAVKLYDASSRLGGVLHSGIPAYRLPQQALQRDLARILQLGIETKLNCLLGREDLLHLQQEFDAVIVCTGLAAAFDLSVPGRELEGIEQGLEFLARVKQGPVELRGDVLVVGGGNTAMDCARSALRCGAASVRVVCREGDDMPAIAEEIREAEQEGVRIARRCQPVSFGGSRVVASAGIAEVKSGTPDAGGRPGFIVTDNRSTIPCDKVILAIGQRAGLDMLPDDWQIKDARAWKAGMQLNVWFAGDCATGDGTVSAAIGNGRRVALAVLTQLASGRGDVALGASQPVAPAQIRFSHFELAPPHRERQIPPAVRRTGFEEVSLGLAGPEEADRCFSCGHCTHCDICLVYCPEGVISRTQDGYRVDEVFCKGCGMCVAECPRNAIEMQEKNRQGVRS
jgi:NADPH-dependent glutamate synthase beta subunit-like oxidoreductase/ferredoxin